MSSLHVPVMPSPEKQKELIETALAHEPSSLVASMLQLFQRLLTDDMLLNPQIGNPVEHHVVVLENIALVACDCYESDNERHFAAACLALLHDICPTPKISREMIDAAQDEESQQRLAQQRIENRKIHMSQGARMARSILNELRVQGYSTFKEILMDETVDEICNAIAIHDNPTIGIPLPDDFLLATILREADRLWMVTDLGIRVDLSRQGADPNDPVAFIEQAQRNVGKFMGERQLYKDTWIGRFQDNCTLFQTAGAHHLYQRYCAEILQHAAQRHDYVRND